MNPAARSASITTGTLVLPETSVGMMEQSTTRRPATPCTRRRSSTTAIGSLRGPILAVPEGWKMVAPYSRQKCRISSSVRTSGPGRNSRFIYPASGSVAASARAYLTAAIVMRRSNSVDR
ncbi:hypothetical protein G6F31_020535 [Rhizopus arrhizus]|nr:hypothetical protein G6F31_020535 [Rhizopus arrhizus]